MPEEFPEIFYENDRAKARAYASYPITSEYIRRLESVALAAYKLWSLGGKKGQAKASDELNDALSKVNFLDEEID